MLMGPGTLGLAATQVNVFVNTLLATGTETGAVSWLNYAFRLMYLPIGLFGVSIATAVLPAVSRQQPTQRRPTAVRDTIADGLSLMLMLNVPATRRADRAGRRRSCACCFEHGAFTAARHRGDGGGAAVLRARPDRLLGRPHRVADLLRARPQPDAGRSSASIAVLVNAALNVVLVQRRSASAGWRSAPRSPRSSTPRRCSCCCAAQLSGINEGRLLGAFAQDRRRVGGDGAAACASTMAGGR